MVRLDVRDANLLQQTDTAKTKNGLLKNPVILVSGIEPEGNYLVFVDILFHICVKQIDGDFMARDAGMSILPGINSHLSPPEREFESYRNFLQQRLGIKAGIGFRLNPFFIHPLTAVSFLIQQRDSAHGQFGIRRSLDMITGENTQPTAVGRKAGGQTDLSAEIGNLVVRNCHSAYSIAFLG